MAFSRKVRGDFDAACLAELEHVGPQRFEARRVVAAFEERGVSPSTGFRWASELLRSGRAGAHLATRIRAITDASPASTARADYLLRPPAPDEIASAGGLIPVVCDLRRCFEVARRIIEQCKNSDGRIRAPRLTLAAVEHMRRCVETSLKLSDALREVSRLEEFHRQVVEEIAKESPECATRIMERLRLTQERWAGPLMP